MKFVVFLLLFTISMSVLSHEAPLEGPPDPRKEGSADGVGEQAEDTEGETPQISLGFVPVLQLYDDFEPIALEASGYDGEFKLTSPLQADLLYGTAITQQMRDDMAGSIIDDEGKKDCGDKKDEQQGEIDRDNPCGPRKRNGRKFKFDLMMRSPNTSWGGKRTPYSEAGFNGDADKIVGGLYGKVKDKNLKDAHSWLMENGNNGNAVDGELSAEVFDSLLRERIVNAGPEQRADIYQEAGKLMEFDRQIEFIAKLGGAMSGNYDDDRESKALSAKGSIKCDDILSGLAKGDPIGVCRDMVICQAQVLEAMGNKGNVYGLSYSSPGSYHVTLVASDPNNPSKVHKVSYDDVQTETDKPGIAALDQGHGIPDVGITYRVWKPDGSMVASLPSEMGLALNEVTGGSNKQDFDPMLIEGYQLNSVGASYGALNGKAFVGQLSNGDRILGVATYLKWGNCSGNLESPIRIGHKGRFGFTYAYRHMDMMSASLERRQYDLHQMYMVLQEEVVLPIRFNEHFTIVPYASARLAATAVHAKEPDDETSWTGDGDLTFDVGARATASFNDGDVVINGKVYSQQTIGLTDIRGLLSSDPTVVTNHTVVAADANIRLDPNLTLFAGTMYAMREYGDTFKVDAGLTMQHNPNNSTAIFTSFQTPVGKQKQGWQPGGAVPIVTGGVRQSILTGNRLQFNIDASYSQVGKDNNMVLGGFSLNWL
jgi:hypothetical protein